MLCLDGLFFLAKYRHPFALQKCFCIDFAENLDERTNEPSPPRLMAGADAGAVVTMEVFIEQQVVPPVRIALKLFGAAENRPPPVFVAQENADQAISDFVRYFEQVHQISWADRALDFEVVAVIGETAPTSGEGRRRI